MHRLNSTTNPTPWAPQLISLRLSSPLGALPTSRHHDHCIANSWCNLRCHDKEYACQRSRLSCGGGRYHGHMGHRRWSFARNVGAEFKAGYRANLIPRALRAPGRARRLLRWRTRVRRATSKIGPQDIARDVGRASSFPVDFAIFNTSQAKKRNCVHWMLKLPDVASNSVRRPRLTPEEG